MTVPADDRTPLSEAQLEIMNLVWDRGEVTVADVWKALAKRRKLARNTVQTMIVRLEEKGWLTSQTEGHAFRYRAAVPREAAQGMMVRRLLDSAFGGSAEGLVLALLEGRGISRAEAQRVRAMIERAEQARKPKEGKS
jgi:BlaI family transcriptional regulator, penicillinase repressor